MKLQMTVEIDVREDVGNEACLEPAALMDGKALLLMHSNELGCTLGQVRVLAVGEKERSNAK